MILMKVCVERRNILDKENITLRPINQPWKEKNINLNLSLIIMNLKLWLIMTGKLNNMPAYQ